VQRKQQQRTHLLSTTTSGLQDGLTVGSKPSPQNPAPQNMGILDFNDQYCHFLKITKDANHKSTLLLIPSYHHHQTNLILIPSLIVVVIMMSSYPFHYTLF